MDQPILTSKNVKLVMEMLRDSGDEREIKY